MNYSDQSSIVISASDWSSALKLLFTEDQFENAGVFLCGLSRTKKRQFLLVKKFLPVPIEDYLVREPYHLEISPNFYNSLVTMCEKNALHPIIVHSHPMTDKAWYSPSDDFGEERLLPVLQSLLPGKVVASVVVTLNSANGRRYVGERFFYMDRLRRIGPLIKTIEFATNRKEKSKVEARFDRHLPAIGVSGQRLLNNLRIGIVGVGGTGSSVAEQLARVGVGDLVLVDDDKLDISNVTRVYGSTNRDSGQPKVDIQRKHLAKFSRAKITGIRDTALKQDVLMQLRDCDLVFSCVDNDRTRAALNRFAHQYLIPVIDIGVRLDARTGRVTAAAGRVSLVGPGMTCLRCSHHLNPERIRSESLPASERQRLVKEGYVMGLEEKAPSVVSLNTVVAGLGATGFLNMFLGLTGGLQPATQIYDATSANVFPVDQIHEPGCDICDPELGVKGLGDAQIVSAY